MSENIINTTILTKVAQELSLINLTRRYIYTMSNVDLDAAKKQRLTSIKKYWKCTGQIKLELDYLYD